MQISSQRLESREENIAFENNHEPTGKKKKNVAYDKKGEKQHLKSYIFGEKNIGFVSFTYECRLPVTYSDNPE